MKGEKFLISLFIIVLFISIAYSNISNGQRNNKSHNLKEVVTTYDTFSNTNKGKIKQAEYYQKQYADDTATFKKYQIAIDSLKSQAKEK